MSSRHPNDRDELQEAVFRFLADPKTHKLSEPVSASIRLMPSYFLLALTFISSSERSSSRSWISRRSTGAGRPARRRSQ